MEMTRDEVQDYFNLDFKVLEITPENHLDYIEQNHFGDLLIETYEENNERLKLWRNLDTNGAAIEVEYAGGLNNHVWETVYIESLNF